MAYIISSDDTLDGTLDCACITSSLSANVASSRDAIYASLHGTSDVAIYVSLLSANVASSHGTLDGANTVLSNGA